MIAQRIVRRAVAEQSGDWPERMHPVLRRIYAARGIARACDIEHRLGALLAPDTLGGLDRACAMLADALAHDRRILIVGDFDADGATGTAVAVRGLRLLGARNVAFRVPNRFFDGYGLSATLVATLANDRPDLIVTVDNGIASHAGVDAARALGIAVIVTDHHLPGDTLPAANAIVNPNVSGDAFPSKTLAGVGVMFYLLIALRARLRASGWFAQRAIAEPDLGVLLDLVALGTVADLVPLDFNNRALVEAGLRRIRRGLACAGVAALLVAAQRDPLRATPADLGFAVGPRINAAGRLEDMSLGIECLLADDAGVARALADRLSAINAERRELQTQMVEQAEAAVAHWRAKSGEAAMPVGVVLFDPDWHAGVVGLVASKLKDSLGRPVIACAPAGEGGDEVRASGRSIAGFHLRDALAVVDARHPGLIDRFGGHAMAAGLSLTRDRLPALAAAFDLVARERIASEALDPILHSDGELAPGDFGLDLAGQLRYAGPWGQAFPEPLFDNAFALESWRTMGECHWRLALRVAGLDAPLDAVMFNVAPGSTPPRALRAAYQLDIDHWNGRERLRLLLRHVEPI